MGTFHKVTDEELNRTIQHQPYDALVKWTLLWMFPRWVRPNHITVVRFIASPFVFWLLLNGWYTGGLLAFVLTALTDAIDGTMARTRRQITVWGTMYDGVADKLLIGGVILILVVQHIGVSLAVAILAIEVFSTIGGLYYKWKKGVLHPALWWGKIKMNLQVLATMALLVNIIWEKPIFLQISGWIFVGSIVFAILNIIGHVRKEMVCPR